MMAKNQWLPNEIALLKSTYPNASCRDHILTLFPKRSWHAIRIKAHKLGLKISYKWQFPDRQDRVLCVCLHCGRYFSRCRSQIGNFCSRKCNSDAHKEIRLQRSIEAHKGKKLKPEHKEKAVATLAPYWERKPSEETKQKISKSLKGRYVGSQNPNYGKVGTFKGRHHSAETRLKMSLAQKGKPRLYLSELNRNSEFQRKRLEAIFSKPTKPERYFQRICSRHNLPFKYVGNGQIIIGGINPDFININGRKVIVEIYGRYWHDSSKNENIYHTAKPKVRTAIYAKFGFRCFHFWDDEIMSKDADRIVLERLKEELLR